MLGAEKLRLPRLPEELPPPALAQAPVSRMRPSPNMESTNTAKKMLAFFLILFLPLLFWSCLSAIPVKRDFLFYQKKYAVAIQTVRGAVFLSAHFPGLHIGTQNHIRVFPSIRQHGQLSEVRKRPIRSSRYFLHDNHYLHLPVRQEYAPNTHAPRTTPPHSHRFDCCLQHATLHFHSLNREDIGNIYLTNQQLPFIIRRLNSFNIPYGDHPCVPFSDFTEAG